MSIENRYNVKLRVHGGPVRPTIFRCFFRLIKSLNHDFRPSQIISFRLNTYNSKSCWYTAGRLLGWHSLHGFITTVVQSEYGHILRYPHVFSQITVFGGPHSQVLMAADLINRELTRSLQKQTLPSTQLIRTSL